MITGLVMTTGRWLVWLSTIFPLSPRFLDEEYRDRDSAHLLAGLGFYIGLALLAVTLFALSF